MENEKFSDEDKEDTCQLSNCSRVGLMRVSLWSESKED